MVGRPGELRSVRQEHRRREDTFDSIVTLRVTIESIIEEPLEREYYTLNIHLCDSAQKVFVRYRTNRFWEYNVRAPKVPQLWIRLLHKV